MCSIPQAETSGTSPPADFDFDAIQEQLQLKSQREQQAIKSMAEKTVEPTPVVETVPVVNPVTKPIRLLKREQPRRPRMDAEMGEEARRLEEMTLDERKANYDKIRERIFNSQNSEDARPEEAQRSPQKPKKKESAPAPVVVKKIEEKLEVETPNEVMVETINHLTYVQMLSDQTPPNVMRPPPIQPSSMRIVAGRGIQQPPPLHYGAPPIHPPPTSAPDFSQPPPMHPSMFPPMSSYMPPQNQYVPRPYASNNGPGLMQQPPPPPPQMNAGYGGPPQPLRDCFPPLSATFFPPPNVQFNAKKRGAGGRNVNQPRK